MDWLDSANLNLFVDQPFICYNCAVRFKSAEDLEEHVCAVDVKPDPNAPHNVYTGLRHQYGQMHVDIDNGPREPSFNYKQFIYEFIDEPFICLLCGLRFRTYDLYIGHIRKCSSLTVLAPGVRYKKKALIHRYRCPLCDITYARRRELRKHVFTTHKSPVSNRCMNCGEVYTNKEELLEHVKTEHKEWPFNYCPMVECRKMFVSREELRKHCVNEHKQRLRDLMGGRPKKIYTEKMHCICEICGKSVKNLELHLETHNSARLFECNKCDKTYRTSMMLRMHYKVHAENSRKRHCVDCDKYFTYDSAYYTHRKYFHKEGAFRFKCLECDKLFFLNYELKLHMNMHYGVKSFSCEYCPKNYTYPASLRCHLRSSHPDKPKVKISTSIAKLTASLERSERGEITGGYVSN